MSPGTELPLALQNIAEALLIGLLIGMQREGIQSATALRRAGVRDFILIAVSGGMCGILQVPWLTAAALLGITILVASFAFRLPEGEAGLTTELATIATFCLGFLTSYPTPHGTAIALATTIAVVALLEAKKNLHKLIREGITEPEFNATLRFLAIIFVIYPLLPPGQFGWHNFFSPRQVWSFVILVSSISYVGYFLQKFIGGRMGLSLTGVLGGLASTTAATASFAKGVAEDPEQMPAYWRATVLANAIQFPRVLAVLYVMNPQVASVATPLLLLMMLGGLAFAWVLFRLEKDGAPDHKVALGNPFRLSPAIKFGAFFAGMLLASKAAAVEFGGRGVFLASLIGGSVDVDSVSVAAVDLVRSGRLPLQEGVIAVVIALVSNAVLKTVMAGATAGRGFALRVGAGFVAMFAAGLLILPFWR